MCMKTCKKFFSLFLAPVMLAVFPSYTEASVSADVIQPRLSLGIRWANTPRMIHINVSSLPSNYANEATAAMNVWNRVKDPLTNQSQVTLKGKKGPGTGQCQITMQSFGTGEVGYTYVTYNEKNEYTSTEIWLYPYVSWSIGKKAGCYDVETVVLHELGHALGVAHCHEKGDSSCFSPTCSKNVMQPIINPNTVRTTLQAYDSGSYQFIYMEL